MTLALSHSQAHVERGFSVNKDISTTNMKLQTLIAKRMAADHLSVCGGVENFLITEELRESCKEARTR